MATEKLIPRVRIHEDNFSEEIKSPQYPENCIDYGIPSDYFLEVVNNKEEVIGLFFQFNPFHRKDFSDIAEYALYYDSLGDEQMEEDELNIIREAYGDNRATLEELIEWDKFYEWKKTANARFGSESYGIACYGRLKFPIGLEQTRRVELEFKLVTWFILNAEALYFLDFHKEDILDDLIDIINFLISKHEDFRSNYFDFYIYSGIETIIGIADKLFTKDNIDRFIELATADESYEYMGEVNIDRKAEILAFLMDYKNKHFPASGDSLQLNPDGLNS